MTREINFLTSLRDGLSLYSGWTFTDESTPGKLAPSAFPSFAITLGATKYTRFGFTGQAICGEHAFVVTINYTEHQLKYLEAFTKHSDMSELAQQYINIFYVPPPLGLGELYRIERAIITKVDAPIISKDETRFVARLEGKYFFTLF
jgi:hypothetical protein